MGSSNLIELNGQLYDAVTGKRVEKQAPEPAARHTAKHEPAQDHPAAVRHTAAAHQAAQPHKPAAAKSASSHATNMEGVSRTKHTAAAHPVKPAAQAHRRAQHSQTLMRTTVKKPAAIKPLKRTAPAPKSAAKSSLVHSPSHDTFVKPERVIRSMHISKSTKISRFGASAAAIKATAIPVAPAPPTGTHHQPPVLQVNQHATTYGVEPKSATADPFAAALSRATSHDQPKHKNASRLHRTAARLHVKPRTLAVSGSALALLIVTGVLIQQNAPYVAMKIAASRSGVDATLPAYQPSGYSMERPIDYTPGQVSVTYKSNSDNRDYKLTQRSSSWNSDTLLENVVGHREHHVYQASGRTIYIYDNNTATWVDGGIWYKLEGNANLSSEQLRKIIDSL